jgi:hypothetical protein
MKRFNLSLTIPIAREYKKDNDQEPEDVDTTIKKKISTDRRIITDIPREYYVEPTHSTANKLKLVIDILIKNKESLPYEISTNIYNETSRLITGADSSTFVLDEASTRTFMDTVNKSRSITSHGIRPINFVYEDDSSKIANILYRTTLMRIVEGPYAGKIMKIYGYNKFIFTAFVIKEIAFQKSAFLLNSECNFTSPDVLFYKYLGEPLDVDDDVNSLRNFLRSSSIKELSVFEFFFYFIMDEMPPPSLNDYIKNYDNPNYIEKMSELSNNINRMGTCLETHHIYHNDYNANNIYIRPPADNIGLIDFGEATSTPLQPVITFDGYGEEKTLDYTEEQIGTFSKDTRNYARYKANLIKKYKMSHPEKGLYGGKTRKRPLCKKNKATIRNKKQHTSKYKKRSLRKTKR